MATYTSGKQTRKKLISAAGELAALHGFSNVSVRAVANKAGQNIGSIHYHFKSKLELFKSVLRSATQAHRDSPPEQILVDFEGRLHLPKIQAAAMRALVHRIVLLIFNPENPWWHSRLVYQTMQRRDELWEMLHKEVIGPEIETARKLFKIINPDLSDEETLLHAMMVKTPLIFHAENTANILKFLKTDAYSESYLQKMEDMIVLQTLLLLGLPTEKILYTRTIK